jgi:hypothetical protein
VSEPIAAATTVASDPSRDVGRALRSAFVRGECWFAEGRELFEQRCPDHALADLVVKLLYHNWQVWHYEDQGRTFDDERVIAAWRGGMAHNRERNVVINAIDALFVPLYRPGAELHSESVGAIVDRLTILFLKWKNFESRCARTAAAIHAHMDEMVDYVRALQQRIEGGQVRCLCLPRIKLYFQDVSLVPLGGP